MMVWLLWIWYKLLLFFSLCFRYFWHRHSQCIPEETFSNTNYHWGKDYIYTWRATCKNHRKNWTCVLWMHKNRIESNSINIHCYIFVTTFTTGYYSNILDTHMQLIYGTCNTTKNCQGSIQILCTFWYLATRQTQRQNGTDSLILTAFPKMPICGWVLRNKVLQSECILLNMYIYTVC